VFVFVDTVIIDASFFTSSCGASTHQVQIMSTLHHPNIVIFMGASVSDKNICMVRSLLLSSYAFFFLPSLLVST
jgi:hypothetical protein